MPYQNRASVEGFTVVEVMITLVIAAVLLTLASPAFTDLIANSRMRSEVYALRGLLMEARSEALTERNDVTVCGSDGLACTGDWNDGYIAFFDNDDDGAVDAGERIVLSRTPDTKRIDLRLISEEERVVFNSRGNARTAGGNFNGTFSLCDNRGATSAAGLIVTPVGALTAAVDKAPTDNVVDDHEGNNLACDDT
jgi:type IV fimbrial biogenesis protein FimT